MPDVKLIASRHSAFYSPLISLIAGGFLEKEGLSATYTPAAAGQNSVIEVAEGRADIGQSAVSGSWTALDAGQKPPVAHFAQINAFDGFIVAAREPDPDIYVGESCSMRSSCMSMAGNRRQCCVMVCTGLASNLSDIEGIESPGGDEMMEQWRNGEGDYFHEQGAFPQQLEHEGIGHIVGSIGEIVGPTAFSSLVARWDSLDSDMVKSVTRAYRASREWVNTADPMEVAEAEEPFFPGMAVEATAAAVAYYQKLGNWDGDIAIPRDLYESALDVFEHSGMVGARHAYEDVWLRRRQVK